MRHREISIPRDAGVVILNGHGVDFLRPTEAARYVGRSTSWVRRHLLGIRHYCPGCRRSYYRRQDLDSLQVINAAARPE